MSKHDRLPPWSEPAERGALGCVFKAWIYDYNDDNPQKAAARKAESEALLSQLRPKLFYDLRNRTLYEELCKMIMEGHTLDIMVVATWLKDKKLLEQIGGLERITGLMDEVVSIASFGDYVRILKEKDYLRFKLAQAATITASVYDKEDVEAVRQISEEMWEYEQRQTGDSPLIEIVTTADLAAWKANPKTYLIGNGLISRGDLVVIAGQGGLGKTMLANTLAVAAARGKGAWMDLPVQCKARTFILQSENSIMRMQKEWETHGAAALEQVRFSKPCELDFANPSFRAAIKRFYNSWPFDLWIIDNWLDVSRAEGQEDYLKALGDVRSCVPRDENGPAIVVLAHTRKTRGGDVWRPKVGRALAHEVSGSMSLVAKARTAWVLQPTHDDDDGQVVFCLAKTNNDAGDGEIFAPSCWYRKPGEFQRVKDWDMDAWMNPKDGDNRKVISEDTMRLLFNGGKRHLSLKHAATELMSAHGFAQPTAYRALKLDGKFAKNLAESDGLLRWVEV